MMPIKDKQALEKALGALEKHAGVTRAGRIVELRSADPSGDFKIKMKLPGQDQARDFWVEVKRNPNNATIGDFALRRMRSNTQTVLVADHVTRNQAEQLREFGIQFFDTTGNAYFDEPGLHIWSVGQLNKKRGRPRTSRIFRPPGMKLIYAILTDPGIEERSYRQISLETGVPTPTVGVFISALEESGYLVKGRNNRRTIKKRGELFRRFVENYAESFRSTLEPIRFTSNKLAGRWWENVDPAEFDACWGGETGAEKLTGYLKPQIATIYADSPLQTFQLRYGLVRNPEGEVEILQRFWRQDKDSTIAPPLIIYADLIARGGKRNLETARLIYDEYLTETAESAA